MEDFKLKQISFNYDKEIVEIFYLIGNLHFRSVFTFIVWNIHNHFNENDLKDMITKYG